MHVLFFFIFLETDLETGQKFHVFVDTVHIATQPMDAVQALQTVMAT
jgi:hypothetical protein